VEDSLKVSVLLLLCYILKADSQFQNACTVSTVTFHIVRHGALVKDDRNRNSIEEYCRLGCDAMWLFRNDVSEGLIATIIRVERISELGAVASYC
jgi:uncharacterized membrane protein